MSTGNSAPPKVVWQKGKGGLSLIWADDEQGYLSGDLLRKACRCASCRVAQAQNRFAPGNEIKIADVRPFGVVGLQLFFSDNHSRGIYPWAYLRELTQGI